MEFLVSLSLTGTDLFTPARIRRREISKQIKLLETKIESAHVELNHFDADAPIKQKPPTSGIYADPSRRDYERESEEIEIQLGKSSGKRAAQQRMDELYAHFGSDLSVEEYESMKREREAFIKSGDSAQKLPPGARASNPRRCLIRARRCAPGISVIPWK